MEGQSTQCTIKVHYIKKYKFPRIVTAMFDRTHTLNMRIDNGADVSIMPTKFYDKYTFLHHLLLEPHKDHIGTGNGSIKTHKFVFIPLEIQGIDIQLRVLVCDSAAYTDILLDHDAMLALGMWQDYTNERSYIIQTTVPFWANTEITIPPGKKAIFPLTLVITLDVFQLNFNLTGHVPVWITPEVSYLPYKLKFPEIQDSQVIINMYNNTSTVIQFPKTFNFMYFNIQLIGKENEHINDQAIYSGMTNLSHSQYNKHGPVQSTIDERAFADEWLECNDPHRNLSDMEILKSKINLESSILNVKEKELLYQVIHNNKDVFSM